MDPVHKAYLADPFVLEVEGVYYAYGTDGPERKAMRQTGREIPTLRSRDFKDWEWIGGVVEPSENLRGLGFWAPEVIRIGNRFVMYFSAGGDEGEGQKIRVATSRSPEGPFHDEEDFLLANEPFSIDPHPFRDPRDGQLYLFFSKDFFDDPVGTGVAAVPLSDDGLNAIASPVTILRAQEDWQIYQRNRFWYGQTWPVWHTVEGPFTIYHHGKYWLFYSSGCWKSEGYGIGCAVAESPLGPYIDPNVSRGPSVLSRSLGLKGAGHNSVVLGPDGRDHIVFHAWDSAFEKRQMHVLPMEWTPNGPRAMPD